MAKKTRKEVRDADDVIRDYVEGEMAQKAEEQTEVENEFQSAGGTALDPRRFKQGRPEQPVRYPELAGGDIDAATDTADTTGEEMVGGSNPTPDQDIVDEIGKGGRGHLCRQ